MTPHGQSREISVKRRHHGPSLSFNHGPIMRILISSSLAAGSFLGRPRRRLQAR
jgi:hypothetical protein